MKQRRASSLVELMMCMTAGSSLMLVAIGMVHQTMTVSRQTTEQTDHDRSLARLAMQFRFDAHRASGASAKSENELSLTCSDGTVVTYQFADRHITRRHQRASGEDEQEGFALGGQATATFQALSDPDRVELIIRRDAGLQHVPPRTELHVTAALHKLLRAEQGGEERQP